jgi:hypothetical protein
MSGLFVLATLAAAASRCHGPQQPTVHRNAGETPRRYLCEKIARPPRIDGKLNDRCWRHATETEAFVDIRGAEGPAPRYDTRSRLLWDDDNLYVAAWLEEPNVRAKLTERDSVIYFENDFEAFIDPEGDSRNYFEVQVNARGTVFDLMLNRPYREKGKARRDWNAAGLRSAVVIDGTLNDPSDRDRGWSVEMAIPWHALVPVSDPAASPGPSDPIAPREPGKPPRAGDVWRINFARVQWPEHIDVGSWALYKEADNWAWSPHGEINMHLPDRWGFVEFVESRR